MIAVTYNQLEIVRILLARDDLDLAVTSNTDGDTALHMACDKGYADIVALIAQDRRMTRQIMNMKNNLGYSALMRAVARNQLEIVRILLARDDLDLADTDKLANTALHVACVMGHANADIVAMLGQDRRMTRQIINMKNSYGATALMMAVSRGNLSCVEKMSELDGVDWETKDKVGNGLEDRASHYGRMEVLKFVRKVKSRKDSQIKCKKIKLTKLTKTLGNLETKMEAEKIALEKEFQEKLSAMQDQHKKQKEAIENEIRACVGPAPAPPPAPECPICLESLAPPARLYNCPEGHLLCSDCRTKVQICHSCRKPLQGRATAMEQYLRAVYGEA